MLGTEEPPPHGRASYCALCHCQQLIVVEDWGDGGGTPPLSCPKCLVISALHCYLNQSTSSDKHPPSSICNHLPRSQHLILWLALPFSRCFESKLRECECQERKSGALECIKPLFSLRALAVPHMAHFMAAGEPDWCAGEQRRWCSSCAALGEVTWGKS